MGHTSTDLSEELLFKKSTSYSFPWNFTPLAMDSFSQSHITIHVLWCLGGETVGMAVLPSIPPPQTNKQTHWKKAPAGLGQTPAAPGTLPEVMGTDKAGLLGMGLR